jgi:ATP-dependent DNA helicase RecQ
LDLVKLYDYQLRNPHHDILLKLMLRSYGGLLDHYVSVNEWELGKRLKMHKKAVKKNLTQLAVADVLEYYPRKDKPFISFLSNRVHTLDFSPEWLLENPKREQDRLDGMVKLLESDSVCREKTMLAYFGESVQDDCGRCDVCRKRIYGTEKYASFSKIADQIKSLLKQDPLQVNQLIAELDSASEQEIFDVLHRLRDQKVIKKDKTGLLHWQKK